MTEITVKEGRTGKKFKPNTIAFYFRDDTGFEHYVGQVALIGDYVYIPTNYKVTREKYGAIRVIRQ